MNNNATVIGHPTMGRQGGSGGGSLPIPVPIAQGGTGQTTANSALNALQALTIGQASLLNLLDNLTNLAPTIFTETHRSTGVVAAGFGLGNAVDLQSAAGFIRRVMTDIVSLIVATDGAETARRDISVMSAGALLKTASFGSLSGNPVIYVGDPALGVGILRAGGFFQLLASNTAIFSANTTGGTIFVPITVIGKVLSSDSLKQGTALTNANTTVLASGGSEYTLPAGTLTVSRTLTMGITDTPLTGQIVRITRLDVTANTYVVKDDAATTLYTFPVSVKGAADFKFTGVHYVLDRFWQLN